MTSASYHFAPMRLRLWLVVVIDDVEVIINDFSYTINI